ncbi:sugar transferase (PEP-CTERM/EpsH1 system associated) [Humitalea rosea]|uniref:Sugar transferase (PEP-CTERM/EpsH1 system associated) n=1 Tax=Humitalea rosea TaxID=990373 RepID=A0A2W7J546_9PROT|nr:TIGR03087 family PEP-CTERM/XrtA system glycosyltransferase [Humitalea rosea]PZW46796.1 sugar transferase (PEP-CTERM/EpsH1 system associated) [Humitalea rosea]
MGRRLLFLCHRIPFPPDKGDKIRAWHMLEHLAKSWEVELGCLVDDPADLDHAATLRATCAAVEAHTTGNRAQAAGRALLRARPGLPLTLGWFHAPRLRDWVARGLAAGRYDAVFAYSSAMAPYVMGARTPGAPPRRVLDLVDVDSEKWLAYAAGARGPMRQVWAREARTLLAFERRAVAAFDRSILVSRQERQRFVELAPEAAPRLDWVDNGVDLARFDATRRHPNPYAGGPPALVFTGTMDYRPNIEAVSWFAREVMPALQTQRVAPVFHIVGANPTEAVRALARLPGVYVSGSVADTRPYIAHATAAVAPLRIARGIQNKVLEAMALGVPVIASPEAFEGVRALPGRDLLVAEGVAETVHAVMAVVGGAHPGLGAAGRAAVARGHDWAVTLRRLDPLLGPGTAARMDAGLAEATA